MPTSSLCFKARKRFVKSFPSPLGCCSHFSFTVLFHLSCKARNRIRIHLCLLCKRGIIIMHAQSVVGDQVLVANKWKCLGFPFLVWKHPLILYQKCPCSCSVAQSCLTLCIPMDCSLPGSSIYGILQEEYWSGLPFPPPRIFLTQGWNLHLMHRQADSLPLCHLGSPVITK